MSVTGVAMVWVMEDKINLDAGLSLAQMTVAAGVTSEAHFHTNCTETVHVLSGQIEQRIADEWRIMHAGDTCLIPSNQVHQTRNTGAEPAVMMVAYSSGTRAYSVHED